MNGFLIRGQSTNIYEQHLGENIFSCSCPDHQNKNTFCKHLLFLIVRVGKQFDLGYLFIQRPKTSVISENVDNQCAICFDDLDTEEIVKCATTCYKKYHKQCIDKWLERTKSCPMCRTEFHSKIVTIEEKKDEYIEGLILVENKEMNNNLMKDIIEYLHQLK